MAINDIILISIIVLFTGVGFLLGFLKSLGKIFSIIGGGVASFFLGNVVSGLLINNIEVLRDFANTNWYGSALILVLSYVGLFVLFYFLLKLLIGVIQKASQEHEGWKKLDKVLGVVAGLALGFLVACIYIWVMYFVSIGNEGTANWIINDTGLGQGRTFFEFLLNFNLNAIGKTVAEFPFMPVA